MNQLTGEDWRPETLNFYDLALVFDSDEDVVDSMGIQDLDPMSLSIESLTALLQEIHDLGVAGEGGAEPEFGGLRRSGQARAWRPFGGHGSPSGPLAITDALIAEQTALRLGSAKVPELRAIAEAMGWALRGTRRDAIVDQIAAQYRDPEAGRRALARLAEGERRLLALIDWASFARSSGPLLPVLRQLAPAVERVPTGPPLDAMATDLYRRGYLLTRPFQQVDFAPLPLAWRRLLPLPAELLPAPQRPVGPALAAPDPLGRFQAVLLTLHAQGPWNAGAILPHDSRFDRPDQWPAPSSSEALKSRSHPGELALIPFPGHSFSRGLPRALSRVAGEAQLRFQLAQVILLDLFETVDASAGGGGARAAAGREPALTLTADRLVAWLEGAPESQLAWLTEAWLGMGLTLWNELALIEARDAARAVRNLRAWQFKPSAFSIAISNLRYQLLGWLRNLPAPDAAGAGWVAAEAALRRFYDAVPGSCVPDLARTGWGWVDGQGEPLKPGSDAGWALAAWPLLRVMVQGPLTWLGLVETAGGKDKLDALRLSPLGAAMLHQGRLPSAEPHQAQWSPDGKLSLKLGRAAAAPMALLARWSRVERVNEDVVTWKLDEAAFFAALSQGAEPESLLIGLSAAEAEPPASVRVWVERVEGRWGRVNLYGGLALLTVDDPVTARELAARTPLERVAAFRVSDTCYLVPEAEIGALVEAMRAAGHTPRWVDERAAASGRRGSAR